MKKNVIISLADSKYFDLLNELIDSIKRFKESEKVAFCVLDQERCKMFTGLISRAVSTCQKRGPVQCV